MSEEEIQEEFGKFHQKHADGQMSKQEFVDHCLETQGDSEEHAESLFNVFDLDGNGCMDFMEFMQADSGITLRSIRTEAFSSSLLGSQCCCCTVD